MLIQFFMKKKHNKIYYIKINERLDDLLFIIINHQSLNKNLNFRKPFHFFLPRTPLMSLPHRHTGVRPNSTGNGDSPTTSRVISLRGTEKILNKKIIIHLCTTKYKNNIIFN